MGLEQPFRRRGRGSCAACLPPWTSTRRDRRSRCLQGPARQAGARALDVSNRSASLWDVVTEQRINAVAAGTRYSPESGEDADTWSLLRRFSDHGAPPRLASFR